MTLAICIKCGARKIGAFVRCLSCGYEPSDEVEKAKSVSLSDHYLPKEDLGLVSERIKRGQGVTFDEASIQSLVESIRVVEQDRMLGVHTAAWFTCGVVVILGVMLGLIIMAVSYLLGK